MRFEVVNVITGESFTKTVTNANPVFLGSGPGVHITLPAIFVGRVAAAIGYLDASRSWVLWNHHGRDIVLGAKTLSAEGDHEPIRTGDSFVCSPFEVRVYFDAEELDTATDSRFARDRRANELVRHLHVELIKQYGRDLTPRESEFKDDYIQKLEENIAERAARADGFPADDRSESEIGNHLAGMAVRSELLSHLVADAGEKTDNAARKLKDGWERLRTRQKALEDAGAALVTEMAECLDTGRSDDLTEQIERVETGFWPAWDAWVVRKYPSLAVRRYLAVRRLKKEIKDSWYGYGPLEELLDDPTISEIMVVDRDHIFIEKNGRIENTGRRFVDDKSTEGVIGKIVDLAGRQINTSEPMVDARMPDGSRVNAIIPPLALKGPCLTIRRFPGKRLTVDQLIAKGSLTTAAKNFLRAAVISRRNVIVSGGTGTGKTTMLNCLSGFIPDHERIVTVEDTAELQLHKAHVVTLQSKHKNSEGKGEIDIERLVINTLRMRPDRIVVGECRGGEALDMLQAMNTGHDGSLTTIHANSPGDVIGRLEVLCRMNKRGSLPVESIHRQIASAVDVIVQLGVVYGENRRPKKIVTEIAEVAGMDPDAGGLRIVPLFARHPQTGPLRPTGQLATFTHELVASGLVADPVSLIRDDAPAVAG